MERLAIIDADTILYIIALRAQGNEFTLDPDFPVEFTDEDYDEMVNESMEFINNVTFDSGCGSFRAYLTGKENFRYKFLPSYKWRRDPSMTPVALKRLKELVLQKVNVFCKVGEEADDSCTRDFTTHEYDVTKVCCHIDKDLNQVAGEHYGYINNGVAKGTYHVTEKEADDFLWLQVLAGDTADCYKGCPMVGDSTPANGGLSKARRIIHENLCVKPHVHTYTKGKNKGKSVLKWEEYIDKTQPIEQRVLGWYVKGYIVKGGQGHVKGFDTTSGFEDNVKLPHTVLPQGLVIDEDAKQFLYNEINIQYNIAYMLRAGEDIPTEMQKVF